MRRAFFILALLSSLLAGAHAQEVPVDVEFFEKRIRPIFAKSCFKCHGDRRQRGGLRLDHLKGLLKGGDNGPALVRGAPEKSLLVEAISYENVDLQMPPRGKLEPSQIQDLKTWIKGGAPWPDEEATKSEGAEIFDLKARREAHWAWQPVLDAQVPEISDSDWPKDDVDRFILHRLKAASLKPAADADRRTWLRRVNFDLIGLPPSVAEQRAFLADKEPGAKERVVDRLLASPHFGERWARHWMDLVRYAESYGHEFDYPIRHAFRYRDYLIRALNDDLPYDRLLTEHIAGDLLEKPRRHPQHQTNESILGTGFWHFSQATHGPVDVRGDEAERVDNQIDVMTKTFLGMTVACARCHDHKFDAISTADYYALAGYLQSSRRQNAYLDPQGKIAEAAAAMRDELDQGRESLAQLLDEKSLLAIDRYLVAAQELSETLPVEEIEIEAKDLSVLKAPAGHYRSQGLDQKWTHRDHMWWTDGKPGDRLTLSFDLPQKGRYDLSLAMTKARDYGVFALRLNGRLIKKSIDLYDPQVVPTGPVSFGTFDFKKGRQEISFEITGANKKAVKAYMFGLDYLQLKSVDARFEEKRKKAVTTKARSKRLDPDRLEAWLTATTGPADLPKALTVWNELAKLPKKERKAAFQSLTRTNEEGHPVAKPGKAISPIPAFEKFDEGFGSWFVTGEAFGERVTREGDLRLGGESVQLVPAGLAHSGLIAERLQGTLRSPTFVIEKKFIHYRLAGRRAQVRLIIDSYVMDVFNGLLFNGLSFNVNHGDSLRWHQQGGDLSRYLGHRAHIEILDEGDGWIAVDEIRFSDTAPPASAESSWPEGLAAGGPPASRERLAKRIQKLTVAAAKSWRQGKDPGETERGWLNFLIEHGLLEGDAPTWKASRDSWRTLSRRASELPRPLRAVAMADGSPEDEHVFVRGSHKNLGPVVPRRFLEALGGEEEVASRGSGRLSLAAKILDESNPLTSRVIVNRVWHHLFGRGLVPSTDNFGVLGTAPTHPELLDHLAYGFRHRDAWSLKTLIKRLVLTRTYGMASLPADDQAGVVDPTNELLHRMRVRRLAAESIRDAMLAVSGRLDPKMYGPSVAVHLTPFMTGRGRPGTSGPVDGEGRRSVYLQVRRNFLSPLMTAFDMPLPFTTQGRRSVSNVPAQALSLMNDPFVIDMARRWGEKTIARSPDEGSRIDAMFERALGRLPDAEEREEAMQFLAHQKGLHGDQAAEHSSWQDLAHVMFNLKEFLFVR